MESLTCNFRGQTVHLKVDLDQTTVQQLVDIVCRNIDADPKTLKLTQAGSKLLKCAEHLDTTLQDAGKDRPSCQHSKVLVTF